MSDSGIFSERRTRSQLVLPDDILQVPQRSPMKHARTAIMTRTNVDNGPSTSMTSSEDELLLSPRKHDSEGGKAGGSKRSVSPEPENEYLRASDSSPDGRELKRVKRETEQKGGDEMAVDNGLSRHTMQRLAAGNASNDSVDTIAARQFTRKRSATTSKKPSSTASASLPRSVYSPTASPTKGRAQSVPLFPPTNDMPRIDFRNVPPTPSRSRSPSRSPVRQKLRIASGPFPTSSSLPTIRDVPPEAVVIPESPSSVPEENELPRILEPLDTKYSFDETIRPPMTSTCLRTAGFPDAPATPMAHSLDQAIPMSPLTPIFETPCPSRNPTNVETEERIGMDTKWGDFHKEITVSNGLSSSRIPRPMAPPTNIPSKMATSSNKHAPVASAVSEKNSKKNAFDMLMKKSLQVKEKVEGKTRLLKGITAFKGTSLKSKSMSSSAKQQFPVLAFPQKFDKAADSVDKPRLKMKEKMRPREKPKTHKGPLFIPMSEDEDDDDDEVTPIIFTDDRMDSDLGGTTSRPIEPSVQKVSEHPQGINIQMQVDGREKMLEDDPRISNVLEDSGILPENTENIHRKVVDLFPSITNAVSLPLDGSSPATKPLDNEESKPEEASNVKQLSLPKPGSGKLSLGKKRQPASIVPVGRVTRSSSKQLDLNIGSSKPVAQNALPTLSLKRTSSRSVKKPAPVADKNVMDIESIQIGGALPPGSPMKTSTPVSSPAKSPAATTDDGTQTINFGAGRLSLANTLTKSKSSVKPASSPSPSKIARARSMFIKPTLTSVSQTFSVDVAKPTASASGSSLSTLSNALEKLRMPPPSRPNTSMGFNRSPLNDEDEISKPVTKDDAHLNRESLGINRPAPGLKRSITLGSGTFRDAGSSSTKASTNGKNFVQKPLLAFMSAKSTTGVRGPAMRGTSRMAAGGSKLPHFGVGGPIRRTVSKKTSLPMVIGSPVRGGGGGDTTMQDLEADPQNDGIEAVGNDSDVFKAPANASTGSLTVEDLEGEQSSKGKERGGLKTLNASRRVSMISHALSQSLSTLPQPSNKGLMGPPANPSSARSTSSSYPASSTSTSECSPSQAGTRSSARIATKISQAKDEQNLPGKKGDTMSIASPSPVSESLGILNDCITFVDVKTDDGDEAGSLFIEMLEGIGAKVLTRVGQTCTHIVYKNGLMSTLTRYRLLRDPKPLVVGIGWVVECVEKRKRVDETDFFVDLEGVNVAGINKRRRSILPKLLAETPDDTATGANENPDEVQIESSADMTSPHSDLAPLERARRRKSMLIGPRS